MSALAVHETVPAERSLMGPLLGCSLLLHVLLLVGAPLVMRFFWQSKRFERPQTFQLVSMPRAAARSAPAPAQPKAEPRKAVEPAPAPKAAAEPTPAEQPREEENVDELNDLLNNVATPMQVSGIPGNFRYHWYLNAVEQKARRYWNPPAENTNDSVIVTFTIFSDGRISDVKIAQSSGASVLDNLATRTFMLAAPFGKLPPGFSEDRLDLVWTLRTQRR